MALAGILVMLLGLLFSAGMIYIGILFLKTGYGITDIYGITTYSATKTKTQYLGKGSIAEGIAFIVIGSLPLLIILSLIIDKVFNINGSMFIILKIAAIIGVFSIFYFTYRKKEFTSP